MTDKTVSISDLEARLVYIIHRELGYQVGEIFTPSISLKSETDRHTFNQLIEHKLFIRTGSVVPNAPARFMLTQNALEAYNQWAQRCPSCISGEPHMHVTKANHNPIDVPIARVVPNPSDVLIADPLTEDVLISYRGALKEIMTIIEDHDANCAESKADEVLTEIYQLIEHILDLHETTQE